jgi:hypothetical protein
MPSPPIERGKPGAGLVAHVLTAKYCDHLPLYRQSEIYAREGVDLSRSTMADWVGRASALLAPLIDALRAHVFAGDRLHGDDSVLQQHTERMIHVAGFNLGLLMRALFGAGAPQGRRPTPKTPCYSRIKPTRPSFSPSWPWSTANGCFVSPHRAGSKLIRKSDFSHGLLERSPIVSEGATISRQAENRTKSERCRRCPHLART